MNKSLLLLSYVFPPYPGIGGRRWAKFSKYLSRKGYTVHVITAASPFKEISQWTKDVENNPRIIRHALPPRYPSILLKQPRSLFEKISYRFQDARLKRISQGNTYERALFWKPIMLEKAQELIRAHSIRNVIATGAPFHLLHHSLALKKTFPDLNLIADFRDQWTDNLSFGGYRNLSASRMNFERKIESEVLQHSDCVMSVSEVITENLRKRSAGSSAAFVTLHNGFDEEDFVSTPYAKRPADNRIRFVFTGNLYDELENIVFPFLKMIADLKKNSPVLYNKLSFSFWGNTQQKYLEFVKQNGLNAVHFHPPVPVAKAFSEMADADYCMLFLNDDHHFTRSTKFAEYAGMKKMIVAFSNTGMLQQFLVSNKIGYACTPATMGEDFLRILTGHEKGENFFNPEFDTAAFSLPALTDNLERLLA